MNFYSGANVSMAPGTQTLDGLLNLSGPAPLPSGGGMSFAPNNPFPSFGFSNNFLPQGGAPLPQLNLGAFNPLPSGGFNPLPSGGATAPTPPLGFNTNLNGAGMTSPLAGGGLLATGNTPPAGNTGNTDNTGNTGDGGNSVKNAASKFFSQINDMMNGLFDPDNKGMQMVLGAGLQAYGANQQIKGQERIADKNREAQLADKAADRQQALDDREWNRTTKLEDRDWEKDWQLQLSALQQKYAMEQLQARNAGSSSYSSAANPPRAISFGGGSVGGRLK